MQTACTPDFLTRVQPGEHLLLVADEVHRIGSPAHRSILTLDAGGRLGLSATPERYGDPEGTAALFFFGQVLAPEFTLADAIASERLVPYDYFVHPVGLTQGEQNSWNDLTNRIRMEYARLPTDKGSSYSPTTSS